jgi:hypothetical protein
MKRQRDLHRYLCTEPLWKREPRIRLSKAELRTIAEQAIAARRGGDETAYPTPRTRRGRMSG